MLTLPATSTEATPLKEETTEESARTDVTTQTKLERDQTDMELTKTADTTVILPQTNLNKAVFLATNDRLPLNPEDKDQLSHPQSPDQGHSSPPVVTNLPDLLTAKTILMTLITALSMALNMLSLHQSLSSVSSISIMSKKSLLILSQN